MRVVLLILALLEDFVVKMWSNLKDEACDVVAGVSRVMLCVIGDKCRFYVTGYLRKLLSQWPAWARTPHYTIRISRLGKPPAHPSITQPDRRVGRAAIH